MVEMCLHESQVRYRCMHALSGASGTDAGHIPIWLHVWVVAVDVIDSVRELRMGVSNDGML